ncbi:hypothetical protein CERZMDRAFT_85183 [Cercospora zeae-maydis SCOH1-5]|uniref:Uncharacterized protein n=1 Tax=Cercospora zeae-maydis SCOH1-5 TaxID=717836 RepID=A0A6A6FEG0_9PEZI|nr:hypothetical protein CERZMDRAFT_85183 [Cercospora zeae-maydis SCOH1-5]
MPLNRMGLKAVLLRIPFFNHLPVEVQIPIIDLVDPPQANDSLSTTATVTWPRGPRLDPSVPPQGGVCPMIAIPVEVFRKIMSGMLPAKDSLIKCVCGEATTKEPNRKPRHNQLSDLLSINKKFNDWVKNAVYEERFFEVHVHQGGTGGVEFLDAGYQPLAYCDSAADDRFAKFTTSGQYGFHLLKKVAIKIFPADTIKRNKAISLNTYFMVQALCRLLERGGKEENRIVNISITFPPKESSSVSDNRHSIMADEHYWWDPVNRVPRCTSFHGISDIELVLHPFATLTRVHNVRIDLPPMVRTHEPTLSFVSNLMAGMRSKSSLPTLLLSSEQEFRIQCMRLEVEDFVFSQKFGKRQQDLEDVGEDVLEDKKQDEDDDDFEVDDEGDEDVDRMAWGPTHGGPALQAAIMASFEPPRVSGSSPPTTSNSVSLTGQLYRERRAATARIHTLSGTPIFARRDRLISNRFHTAGGMQITQATGDAGAEDQQEGDSQPEPDLTTAEHHGISTTSVWRSYTGRIIAPQDSDDEMTGV